MAKINRAALWWTCGLIYILFMLWLSLRPSSAPPSDIPHFDKVLHATAHFVLCSWFLPLLNQRSQWKIVAFSVFQGASIEFLQSFVPSREPDILDILANTSGALLAYGLMRAKPSDFAKTLIYRNNAGIVDPHDA